ncbi:MAG: hypothetical protein GY754_27785, partial [bacterium]|nr:hypothetical protein [bacterium]
MKKIRMFGLFLTLLCGVAFSGCEQGLASNDASSDDENMKFSFSDMYKKLASMEDRIKTLQDTVTTQTGSIVQYDTIVGQMQTTIDAQAGQITVLEGLLAQKADASGVYSKGEMDVMMAPEAKTGVLAYSDEPVLFDDTYLFSELRDEKDEYNPATGTFTAKKAGYYLITVTGRDKTSLSGQYGFRILKNNTRTSIAYSYTSSHEDFMDGGHSCSTIQYLEVGDSLKVETVRRIRVCEKIYFGVR